VDPKTFLRHLHEAYETLDGKTEEDSGKPAYFRFLTLLCFRIFLEAKVDVAILEVGLGGRLDATNCIQLPVVCGVSALGFDHMNVLGYTLPEISREKAGIFKQGCPAFSVPQKPDAMQTLEEVAESKQTPLSVIEPLNSYNFISNESHETVPACLLKLGLPGEHQRENAALAIKLAAVWESRCGVLSNDKAQERASMILEEYKLPKEYVAGLEDAKWPGRAEIFDDPESCNMTFFIDGAHTPESMKACAEWFSYESKTRSEDHDSPKRIVVFNCMEEREPENLMGPLQQTLIERDSWPEQVVFTPTLSSYTKLKSLDRHLDTSWQQKLKTTWDQLPFIRADRISHSNGVGQEFPINRLKCPTSVSNSLPEALQGLRNTAKVIKNKRVHVLVTGSLYLVGDMLKLLGKSA
jgi:folylpolyglutamate synthase